MYGETMTLEELERNYLYIKQSFGETIRNYGHRLNEAIEKYKKGYKTKYGTLDESYKKHINNNAIQIFKRGLNNTIVKEKIATSRTENLEEIIEETDTITKLLSATIETNESNQYNNKYNESTQEPRRELRQQIISCNYCSRPGHTWDICRTRINQENQQRRPQYQQHSYRPYTQPSQQTNTNRFPNQRAIQQSYQNRNNNNFQQQNQIQQPKNQHFPNNIDYRGNTTRYVQVPRYAPWQPKYCSHCKTTTGHTFNECRSKFFTQHSRNAQPPDINIEDKFSKLRINQLDGQDRHNMNRNPENPGGSNQE